MKKNYQKPAARVINVEMNDLLINSQEDPTPEFDPTAPVNMPFNWEIEETGTAD